MHRKLMWRDWNPGLDNGHLRLGEVLATLPAAEPEDIPWLVRLLENPASLLALPGAITLARHDALHVLLGRGLSPQDEGFVIGYTMGAAKTVRPWQFRLFRFVASVLYPKAYRFSPDARIAFDLGFAKGQQSEARDLHAVPFEELGGERVDALRRRLGVNLHKLHAAYRMERARLPHTRASQRLDLDVGGADPSALRVPEGEDSDWKRE